MTEATDLPGMRRSYDSGGLDPADLAPTWRVQLGAWLDAAEGAGLPDPNAMVLATVDADGRPSTRTVLCKGIDERGLVFFTNHLSRKGKALDADPRAAVTFPWLVLERQVCVTGDIEHISRAETVAYATSRPRGSQLGAWISRQSEVIDSRDVLEQRRAALEDRFAGADVPVPEFWGGYRLLPLTVEFWAGRPDRLHDRLVFVRRDGTTGAAGDDGWRVERRSP